MNQRPSRPRGGKPPAKTPPRTTPPRPPLEARHKWLLAGIGVVLACLLLGGLELVLRLTGYGPDLRVFKPREILGEKYFEFNRDISLRYFPKEMAKEPGFARFPARKAPNTYRVFSLGESSTQGDPYGPQASYSAFLEEMLTDLHPDRKIEIVNCGIVAISSADVLDLLPEILRHQPDAILLYVGHNEAYGADGVLSGIRGSVTSRAMMKLRIRARNTRVGMLLRDFVHKVRAGKGAQPQGFGMELMEGKVLPHWSSLHRQMLEIYRGNLQEMCDRAFKAGSDVILCTPVSDLRDQSPMGSAHGPALTDANRKQWEDAFAAGKAAMAAGRRDEAIRDLRTAVQLDTSFAEARFRLARCLDPREWKDAPADPARVDAARREYRAACDEDIVHFRACSDQNRVVREVAARNRGSHLVLVDLEKETADASPDGMPGREFMTEHVHPYILGHEFLAERICRDLAESPVGAKLGSWDLARLQTPAQYLQRMGLADGDEAVGLLLTIQHKLNKWPFTSAYENRRATEFLQARMGELTRNLDPIEAQVFAEIQAGRFNNGYDYGLRHQEIARRAMTAQRVPYALHEFHLCETFWGPNAETVANLAQANLLGNTLQPVDSLLDVAANLDPKLARVRFLRGMLRRAQGRMPEARTEFEAYLKLEPTSIYASAARQILMQRS